MDELIPPNNFPRVKAAREALRVKAEIILSDFQILIKEAAAAGKYDAALSAQQWLIEHLPDEDGERVVNISVDKPKQIEQYNGPSIMIGLPLGGMTPPVEEIPPAVDVRVVKGG